MSGDSKKQPASPTDGAAASSGGAPGSSGTASGSGAHPSIHEAAHQVTLIAPISTGLGSGTHPSVPGSIAPPSGPLFVEETNPLFARRYQIQSLVGSGGMGTVYMARDIELDEIVALKVLRRESISHPGALEMFRREVKLARLVTHPNVARTFDIGETDGQKYLTMEYVEGMSLARHLEVSGSPSISRCIEIITAICDGLAAAHAVGVIHRDLKPENVLIGKDGRVVLTDFGVARTRDAASSTATMGLSVGTPAYMSPEQVEARPDIDHRSDIYALGVVMFEMLTRAFPFAGESPLALAAARLLRPPIDIRTLRADVPTIMADTVMKCLERDRESRIGAVADVGKRLSNITTPISNVIAADTSVATVASAAKAVAVLPFKAGSTADDQLVAEGLLDDLIDGLSMTNGLRVRPRSRVQNLAPDGDPVEIGRSLGVDVVVQGSVRRAGDQVRVSARLLNVDGFQIWAKRFDRPSAELFALSDAMAKEVAEALTVARTVPDRAQQMNPAAMDLYLRARTEARRMFAQGPRDADQLYREALQHAPDDPMILGGYAHVQTRMWFFGEPDAQARARDAATRAMALAPMLPEARYALALLDMHSGNVGSALRLLKPLARQGSVLGNETLATLLSEIGLIEESRMYVDHVLKIDPESSFASFELARHHAVAGDWDACDAMIERLQRRATQIRPEVSAVGIRFLMWRGDLPLARERVRQRGANGAGPISPETLFAILAGTVKRAELEPAFASSSTTGSLRRRAVVHQIEAEAASQLGDLDWARDAMQRSVNSNLIDLIWVRRCPAIAPLRTHPGFAPLAAQVEQRAADLSTVYRRAE